MAIEIEDLNNMEKEAIVISDLSSDEIEDIHVEDIINIPLIKGDKGDKGEKGEKGEIGQQGYTFTPNVSPEGFISWSNDGNLPNPTEVNIKGQKGDKGDKGDKGEKGEDGQGTGDMLASTYDKNGNGIVDNAEKVNSHTVNSDVPENAKFTDTTYTDATENNSGLMSAEDKTKLDGISNEANKYILPTASNSELGGIMIGRGLEVINGVVNTKNNVFNITTTAVITQNTNYTVPQKYYVGKNDMQIFFEGCLLVKDINYIEVGTSGGESTKIQFKDWSVPTASKLEFLYR